MNPDFHKLSKNSNEDDSNKIFTASFLGDGRTVLGSHPEAGHTETINTGAV